MSIDTPWKLGRNQHRGDFGFILKHKNDIKNYLCPKSVL